jgi:alpha-beta hydrolase superfamily lysophospholipase
MEHIQGTFRGVGGLDLFYQAWLPEGAPRAAMAIVHGAGDHSGRFSRLVLSLAQDGFAAYAFDLRGFGRSPGRRGHINRWSEYREDVRCFLALIGEKHPAAPLFLMGYSLGAGIVLDTILRSPEGLRGAVLSAAPIEPSGVATPVQIAVARLLSRIWPSFALQLNNDINGVSRDTAVLDELRADPLHHSWATTRWGAEVLAATDWARQQAVQIRLPVMFVHGGDDPFNLVGGVERFYQQITYPDKALHIYPGSRHETHNDLDHAKVAADISDWMAQHL